MSIKVSSLVYERGPALAGWRFLMGAMADNADDQGYCFPGVALLAAKTCASERTVLRRIVAMEAAGWLTVEVRAVHRRGTSARNRVNAYQLNMARLRGEQNAAGETELKAAASPVAEEDRRCDTVSDRGVVDDVTTGAKPGVDDVTKTTRRCDKPGIAIRKNRQEPRSKNEPRNSPQPPVPGGGAAELVADAFTAEARRVLRGCVLSDPRLEGVIVRSLRQAVEADVAEAVRRKRAPSTVAAAVARFGDTMIANWARMEAGLDAGTLRHGWGPRKFFAGPWLGVGWPWDQRAASDAARRNVGRGVGVYVPPTEAVQAERERKRLESDARDSAYFEARGREAEIQERRRADRQAVLTEAELAVFLNPSAAYRSRAS